VSEQGTKLFPLAAWSQLVTLAVKTSRGPTSCPEVRLSILLQHNGQAERSSLKKEPRNGSALVFPCSVAVQHHTVPDDHSVVGALWVGNVGTCTILPRPGTIEFSFFGSNQKAVSVRVASCT